MDRQQSKEETEKEKQELPLVNIEQNDSLIEKEKRIGKKVIICFFFFFLMCNTFDSKNSTFYSHINKLSNNHQGTLWLNLGIWIDSSKNN